MTYFLAGFWASFLVLFLQRGISAKMGLNSKATAADERWSTRPVPTSGGLSIFIPVLFFLILQRSAPAVTYIIPLVGVLALGFIDDRYKINALKKLVVQAFCVFFLLHRGLLLEIGPKPLQLVLTGLFMLFFINALNLLDNMDGIVGGLCTIVFVFLALLFRARAANALELGICLVLAGSCLGFLLHNFKPARIYMGDTGSLALGLTLSALGTRLTHETGPYRPFWAILLLLFLPLADTAFVYISRKRAGRPFLLGGADHLAHRLVRTGISERKTALLMYGAAAFGGGVALLVLTPLPMWLPCVLTLGLLSFSFALGRVLIRY